MVKFFVGFRIVGILAIFLNAHNVFYTTNITSSNKKMIIYHRHKESVACEINVYVVHFCFR